MPVVLPALILHGMAIGLEQLTNLEFNPNYPHTYCRICGAIFQNGTSRISYPTPAQIDQAANGRKAWSRIHARTHTEKEHLLLKQSGMWLTPEAGHKLAAFGVLPLIDIVLNAEMQDALLKSSPIPTNDSEG